MRIHDKYVIELKEVIKGYGNDPTVQDPCKFPCDYKFYEIDGVAICEESFKKMTPLNDLVIQALEDVRADVEKADFDFGDYYDHTETIKQWFGDLIDRKIKEIKHDRRPNRNEIC